MPTTPRGVTFRPVILDFVAHWSAHQFTDYSVLIVGDTPPINPIELLARQPAWQFATDICAGALCRAWSNPVGSRGSGGSGFQRLQTVSTNWMGLSSTTML